MKTITQSDNCSLYQLDDHQAVKRFIVSTPQTRSICNDPFVLGTEYTRLLQHAMTQTITALDGAIEWGEEAQAMVLHILRGGLNFGLREALADANSWNRHNAAYISSQRAKDDKGGWYITENRYEKVYIPKNATMVFGDVVATGVSLEHALKKMIELAKEQQSSIGQIVFFTIGGDRAEQILASVDQQCREAFPDYTGSSVVYIEGIFGVANEESSLQIRLTGTDLLRNPAVMAPEFVESQNEQISYPLERCTIYDAGSRAFHVQEYLEDVREYWTQVQELAQKGTTLAGYMKERYPQATQLQDDAWVTAHDTPDALRTLAEEQLKKAS
jgi:hypothetical protein